MRILLLLFLCGCEATLHTSILADAVMTNEIQHSPGVYERNPFLGDQPSTESVVLYFGALMIAHHLILKKLPDKHRPYWIGAFSLYYGSLAYDNCERTGKC